MEDKTIETLTLTDFFWGIFPGCYICARSENGGQFDGRISTAEEKICSFVKKYVDLNKQGYNILFTPNGLKEGSFTNKSENFDHINAWWVDIDIDETKQLPEDEVERAKMLLLRHEKKAEILAKIFSSRLPLPSMLNETRNGYQAIWFALPPTKIENFRTIQEALVYEFSGDIAAGRITSLIRLPRMTYYKKGESGEIKPNFTFSTCQLVTESEMLLKIKQKPIEKKQDQFCFPTIFRRARGFGIWDKIDQIPITEQIRIISGSYLVGGEEIVIKKKNIFANGKSTPVWADLNTNSLYSQNMKGMKSLLQFCMWYGHDKEEVTRGLKILFNLN